MADQNSTPSRPKTDRLAFIEASRRSGVLQRQERAERQQRAERALAEYYAAHPTPPKTKPAAIAGERDKVNPAYVIWCSRARGVYRAELGDDDDLARGGYKNGRSRGPER